MWVPRLTCVGRVWVSGLYDLKSLFAVPASMACLRIFKPPKWSTASYLVARVTCPSLHYSSS